MIPRRIQCTKSLQIIQCPVVLVDHMPIEGLHYLLFPPREVLPSCQNIVDLRDHPILLRWIVPRILIQARIRIPRLLPAAFRPNIPRCLRRDDIIQMRIRNASCDRSIPRGVQRIMWSTYWSRRLILTRDRSWNISIQLPSRETRTCLRS